MSEDPRSTRSRQAILRAVVEIIETEGPGAVTHQHVAARAGIGRATVYRHWPKHVDLLSDAMEQLDLPFLEPAQGPLRERLRVDLRRLDDDLAAPGMPSMIATIIDRAPREPSYRARNERLVTHVVANMHAALDHAVELNELDGRPDPEVLVSQLLGAILFRRLIADQPTTDNFIDDLIDTALAAFVTHASPSPRLPANSTDERAPRKDSNEHQHRHHHVP